MNAMSEIVASERRLFLDGMARVAHAVSIVTTDGLAGRDGMTVTALSTVSADTPHPTLLVCIKAASRPAPLLRANGAFCVNVLATEHRVLADRFAGRLGHEDDWFAAASWSRLFTGAPALDGALVNFDCEISELSDVGTHHVVFGAVHAARIGPGRALLHADRAYRSLSEESLP